jgi:hypothetical protein
MCILVCVGWEIAPELLNTGKTRFNSDLYQVGLVVYNLASGCPAISAKDGDGNSALRSGVPKRNALALPLPAPFRYPLKILCVSLGVY